MIPSEIRNAEIRKLELPTFIGNMFSVFIFISKIKKVKGFAMIKILIGFPFFG